MHGKFGPAFPGEKRAGIARHYPFLFRVFLCAVFLCFRNPPKSNMDYRIFNVRTFLCVHIPHTGVGHTDNESAQHFDSEKLSQILLVLRTGLEPLVMESNGSRGKADALPSEPPRPPSVSLTILLYWYHVPTQSACNQGVFWFDTKLCITQKRSYGLLKVVAKTLYNNNNNNELY